MKDILFLFPLFYTPNGVTRFAQYLREEEAPYTYGVYMPCSNSAIFDVAKERADREGFVCTLRPNYGGGEGALWWLQKRSGAPISDYRYVWYFEESCEPIRRGWMRRLIGDMDAGAPLVGWWWNPTARRRSHAIAHVVVGANGHRMTYFENTEATGLDQDGKPFWRMYDTPCYRDETFVVRAEDFLAFDYPDATDAFWESRNGIRTYGIKAERCWWRVKDVAYHGIPLAPPNIQWHVLMKYKYVPSPRNVYRSYFRELPVEVRRDENYRPKPMSRRRTEEALARTGRAMGELPWRGLLKVRKLVGRSGKAQP